MSPEDNPQVPGTPDEPQPTPAGADVPDGPKPSGHDALGRFTKENPGRPKGSLNKFTNRQIEEFLVEMNNLAPEDRRKYNGLWVLADLMAHCAYDPDLQLRAANYWCKLLLPKIIELTGKDGGPLELAGPVGFGELAGNAELRAIMESPNL